MIGAVLFVLFVGIIAAINILAWQHRHEWHEAPFRPNMMRRKINGRWQYREMTDDEAAESFSSNAW